MKLELNKYDLLVLIKRYFDEEFPNNQYKIIDVSVNDLLGNDINLDKTFKNIEVTLEKDYDRIIEQVFE